MVPVDDPFTLTVSTFPLCNNDALRSYESYVHRVMILTQLYALILCNGILPSFLISDCHHYPCSLRFQPTPFSLKISKAISNPFILYDSDSQSSQFRVEMSVYCGYINVLALSQQASLYTIHVGPDPGLSNNTAISTSLVATEGSGSDAVDTGYVDEYTNLLLLCFLLFLFIYSSPSLSFSLLPFLPYLTYSCSVEGIIHVIHGNTALNCTVI